MSGSSMHTPQSAAEIDGPGAHASSARPAAAPITAAIFDFDGTLVDSMPLHFEAYRVVLAEVGIELTRDDFYGSIGGNARETIPKFLRGRACTLTPAEIHARKKGLINQLLAGGPITVLETAKLLPVFHGKLSMAVASSGSRAGIEIVLKRFGWQDYFAAVICGEDTQRGKPAPDLFLLAAEKLGASPESCIVFEDTAEGLEAARRAGMRPFDVRATLAPSLLERSE
jgi:beta-phosphoglucomutase-like phosphatase (HAD superfamily)